MSRLFNLDERHAEYAKSLSIKVFAISDEVRDQFINYYCEYCRQVYINNFIEWRVQKLRILRAKITFDWQSEQERI